MPRKHDADAGWSLKKRAKRQWLLWGRSPRRLVIVGLVLTTLAASLGVSWLIQGIKGLGDLNGPHQQWHGVVVEHHQGTLLFTNVALRYSLVVGFIDQHNPSATFTVNVDADTFSSVPDGMLITLDLGPQTGHVYALATSHDGITWTRQPLDPGGNQLRLISWLLVPFGGVLVLLGLIGLALSIVGLIDFLGGTESISGMVVDVVEGTFFRMPCVIVDQGNGLRVVLPLRPLIYEKVCEDGGRSQMIFVVSRWLSNVRRARRKRGSGVIPIKAEKHSRRSGDDWSRQEEDLSQYQQARQSGRGNRQPEQYVYPSEQQEGREESQVSWQEQTPRRPAQATPPVSMERRQPLAESWQEQPQRSEERLPQQDDKWPPEDERSDVEAWRLWRDQLRQGYENNPTQRPRGQK